MSSPETSEPGACVSPKPSTQHSYHESSLCEGSSAGGGLRMAPPRLVITRKKSFSFLKRAEAEEMVVTLAPGAPPSDSLGGALQRLSACGLKMQGQSEGRRAGGVQGIGIWWTPLRSRQCSTPSRTPGRLPVRPHVRERRPGRAPSGR